MERQILLTLPDELYQRAKQLAHQRKQILEVVLVDVLDEVLPRNSATDEALTVFLCETEKHILETGGISHENF